jgi:alkylhydroperoxidase family enzyme
MTGCRVEILPLEEAGEAARAVEMIPAFANLNIFRVMLHRPKTAKALSDLLVSLLFGGELDDRLRELLIMRIGWTTGSGYEWTQHWRIAREQFGCSEQDLLAVRDWESSPHFVPRALRPQRHHRARDGRWSLAPGLEADQRPRDTPRGRRHLLAAGRKAARVFSPISAPA